MDGDGVITTITGATGRVRTGRQHDEGTGAIVYATVPSGMIPRPGGCVRGKRQPKKWSTLGKMKPDSYASLASLCIRYHSRDLSPWVRKRKNLGPSINDQRPQLVKAAKATKTTGI
jgi:hypothetical protein